MTTWLYRVVKYDYTTEYNKYTYYNKCNIEFYDYTEQPQFWICAVIVHFF